MSAKKVLKILGYLAASLAVLVSLAVAIVYGVTNRQIHRQHIVQAQAIAVPASSDVIARGRHIVTTRACADCHGKDFGGHKVIDDPLAGVFHGANLTRGAGGLPADYSDMDYVRAIRHGVARDGRPLLLMPSQEYTSLSDEDLGAVIAYLKTLPPVDRPRGPVAPGPIIRMLVMAGKMKLAAEEIDHHATHVASVVPVISAEYGKYLATSCVGCHGETLTGGKIAGAPPDWPAAANLASGPARQWTQEQFIQTLRTRQRPDGTLLNPVMPGAFGEMTDLELKALWTYITSMPSGGETGAKDSAANVAVR